MKLRSFYSWKMLQNSNWGEWTAEDGNPDGKIDVPGKWINTFSLICKNLILPNFLLFCDYLLKKDKNEKEKEKN